MALQDWFRRPTPATIRTLRQAHVQEELAVAQAALRRSAAARVHAPTNPTHYGRSLQDAHEALTSLRARLQQAPELRTLLQTGWVREALREGHEHAQRVEARAREHVRRLDQDHTHER